MLSFASISRFILLLVVLIGLFGAAGYPISRLVILTYWYTEGTSEAPVILELIQEFQQQNPDIKINAIPMPFGRTQSAFTTAAAAGNAPDILRSDISWITEFASQGYLLNIGEYNSQSHINLSDYMSDPLKYDIYKKHYYGLPQVTDFLALLYNKAEFRKALITSPPKKMTTFQTDAVNVVKRKAATYGFETTGTSYDVLPFLWAFGGGLIDPNNYKHILVKNKYSREGLDFLLNLQKNPNKVMPAKVDFSNGGSNMVNDFKSGETAMIFDGPWDVSNILTGSAFSGNTSNLGIAPIPYDRSGDQPRSPLGGQSYVIYANTPHPAEAYKFISFMSQTSSQVAIAEANHTLPTRISAYQDPGVSNDPFIKEFSDNQKTAVARLPIPQGGHLFDVFDPNIQAALDGAQTSTEALNTVADAWNKLLQNS